MTRRVPAFLIAFSILACNRSEAPRPAPVEPASPGGPADGPAFPGRSAVEPVSAGTPLPLPAVSRIDDLLAVPRPTRYRAPGGLRWASAMSFVPSGFRSYAGGGFLVLGDAELAYLTRNGEPRWSRVLGAGYRLFEGERSERIWIPARKNLVSVAWGGIQTWDRSIDGRVFPGPGGTVLSVDASVLEQWGTDGSLVFRFASDQVRALEAPQFSEAGFAITGQRGDKRLLFFLDRSGRLLGRVALDPEEQLLGLTSSGRAVLGSMGRARMLDVRGTESWTLRLPEVRALATRGEEVLLLAAPGGGSRASIHWMGADGSEVWRSTLPTERDPLGAVLLGWPDSALWMAACLGPKPGCRGPGEARTTADALFVAAGRTDPVVPPGSGAGYLAVTTSGGVVIVARAIREDETLIEQRDEQGVLLWQRALSGVFAAGPRVDDSLREVLVALREGSGKGLVLALTIKVPRTAEAPEAGRTSGSSRSARSDRDGGAAGTPDTTGRGTDPGTTGYPRPRAPDAGSPPG